MKKNQKTLDTSLPRPPIVVVLGHVDHGKTTLLDTIRKASVAAKEHGGITQHIGAYQIEVKSPASPAGRQKSPARNATQSVAGGKVKSEESQFITFIDTPGHEAFASMRSRGAKAADIAVLVIAGNDSVKPQTIESIEQIKQANIPCIVAVNKMDLPTANIDKVKQDLAKAGVQVEGFGGDVPILPISAKAGTGVKELLDMVILVMTFKGLTSEPSAPIEAVVIETHIDKGKGMVSSLIVQKGTLVPRTLLFEGQKSIGNVRAMFDEFGKIVPSAGPGKPVEVLGFTSLPHIGSLVTDRAVTREEKPKEVVSADVENVPDELPDFLRPVSDEKSLAVILKVDTAGSLEAVTASLSKRVVIVHAGIGDITEADILLAKSSKAIILGLHVVCKPNVQLLAQTEKVIFRTYTIIYELLDELAEVILGLKEVKFEERELGRGQIIAEFPFEDSRIAGTKVLSGRLARGDTVRVVRDETDILRVKIKSIRQGKEDTTRVGIGVECGVVFDKTVDFILGDAIIAVTTG